MRKYIIQWEIIGPCGFLFLGICARLLPSSTRHILFRRGFFDLRQRRWYPQNRYRKTCAPKAHIPQRVLYVNGLPLCLQNHWEHSGLWKRKWSDKTGILWFDLGPHSLNFCCPELLIIRTCITQTCYGSLSIRRFPRSNHLEPQGRLSIDWCDSWFPLHKVPVSGKTTWPTKGRCISNAACIWGMCFSCWILMFDGFD